MTVGVGKYEQLDLARAAVQRGADRGAADHRERGLAVLPPGLIHRGDTTFRERPHGGLETTLVRDCTRRAPAVPELFEVPPQFIENWFPHWCRELVPSVLEEPLPVLCEVRRKSNSDGPCRESLQQFGMALEEPSEVAASAIGDQADEHPAAFGTDADRQPVGEVPNVLDLPLSHL